MDDLRRHQRGGRRALGARGFFATLRAELVDHEVYARDRKRSIGDYIDNFYNVERRHSFLDYLNPIEFELRSGSVGRVA